MIAAKQYWLASFLGMWEPPIDQTNEMLLLFFICSLE